MKKQWLVIAPLGVLGASIVFHRAVEQLVRLNCEDLFGFVPQYPLSVQNERAMTVMLGEFRQDVAYFTDIIKNPDQSLEEEAENTRALNESKFLHVIAENTASRVIKRYANNPERLYQELGLAA